MRYMGSFRFIFFQIEERTGPGKRMNAKMVCEKERDPTEQIQLHRFYEIERVWNMKSWHKICLL